MLKTEEIKRFINNDRTGRRKRNLRLGQRYYEGKHDILAYRLFYFNADSKLVEDTTRSNIKISHPFFTELVDQCVQYMLSGKESFVVSDDDKLQKELDEYFGEEFRAELSDMLTDVCVGGFGNMYAYKSAKDRLSFQYADALGVIEVKAKETDDKNEYYIYTYVDRIDKDNRAINRIQVWDKKTVTYYVQVGDGEIKIDESEPVNPRPHIVFEKENEEGKFGDSLGYIPFFRMDANRKQISHLQPIKGIIDDYDLMACGLSNNIQDVGESLYVVRGFEGDDMEELMQNIKTKKHIGVTSDGGVDIMTVDIPYEARKEKMQEDEKNIYRFGMGFNSSQIGDGNITNIVIKSRYALLDLKCNKLESKLKSFMKKLIKVVLKEINEQNGTNYAMKDVRIDFKREVMTNAADNAQIEKTEAESKQIKINTILDMAARIDDESVLRMLCDVMDLDFEDIKGRVEKNPALDLNSASETLAGAKADGELNE